MARILRPATCAEEGCDRKPIARGWCTKHYQSHKKTGSFQPVIYDTVEERFWAKVDKNGPGGCWLWTAALNTYGYGVFQLAPKTQVFAHRFADELMIGEPIPDGLTIDHLCRVHECVNPAHLERVTAGENSIRGETVSGINSRKTHCLKGHPFDADNTHISPKGKRICRACKREDARLRRGPTRTT